MELKDIVAISGVSGLHQITGRSKNGLIVETIGSGRKFATSFHDKVSVLEDISIYTLEGDMHLSEVFLKLKAAAELPAKEELKKVRQFLIEAVQLDSERVYDSDLKKLITWFYMLKDSLDWEKLANRGTEAEAAPAEEVKEEVVAEEVKEEAATEEKPKKAPRKTAAKKAKAKDAE